MLIGLEGVSIVKGELLSLLEHFGVSLLRRQLGLRNQVLSAHSSHCFLSIWVGEGAATEVELVVYKAAEMLLVELVAYVVLGVAQVQSLKLVKALLRCRRQVPKCLVNHFDLISYLWQLGASSDN